MALLPPLPWLSLNATLAVSEPLRFSLSIFSHVQERTGPGGHRVCQARVADVDHERGLRGLRSVGKHRLPQQPQRLPSRLHLIDLLLDRTLVFDMKAMIEGNTCAVSCTRGHLAEIHLREAFAGLAG